MWKSVVKINEFVMKFHVYLLRLQFFDVTANTKFDCIVSNKQHGCVRLNKMYNTDFCKFSAFQNLKIAKHLGSSFFLE